MSPASKPAVLPRVRIVSPAAGSANNGNAHTAARWERFLVPVSTCDIALGWSGEPIDVLIALHARRSATSIARFRFACPDKPIALVLTGTDLYGDLARREGDASARHSLECASAVVVLHEGGAATLPPAVRDKTRVIVQSATAVVARAGAAMGGFVAVGHLRDEKDPLTLMRAACAAGPGIVVTHIGAALDDALGAEAKRTMAACPNYRWLGALPHGAARRRIASAAALVHPSRLEGGANVVIEAVRSGVPVLASRIDGNVGLLGAGYDGYFPVGDSAALAALLRRFEAEPAFAEHLRAQCAAREPLFRPAVERAAVRTLLADLVGRMAIGVKAIEW
ncbi:MAG: selenoneine biosynthesis selenosugar synthase SenB [Caldimonas sp.]